MKFKGNCQTGHRVTLWEDGASKDWLVARLVGVTFLGRPPHCSWTINHKDGNRFNNRVENLEWLSLADNIRHGFKTGLYASCQKPVVLKGNKVFEFSSLAEASRFLGRSPGYVHNCVKHGRKARSINGCNYDIATPSGERKIS